VLNPAVVVRIAGVVVRAIKAAAAEVKEAKEPDSDGGRKITLNEAIDVAEAALGAVVGDVADILVGS
jgi:hypothetical protein